MVDKKALENSFANVRKDIMQIKANLMEISGQQAEIFELIEELRRTPNKTKKSKRSSK